MSNYSPLAFVEKLSFVRYGGTAAEKKAADMILADIEAAGGKGELMPFQMEMLQHDFFVFLNVETDNVAVVYVRADGDYGVLDTTY